MPGAYQPGGGWGREGGDSPRPPFDLCGAKDGHGGSGVAVPTDAERYRGILAKSGPFRLATSVRHVRRDQKEPDPTESDTAPAGSY